MVYLFLLLDNENELNSIQGKINSNLDQISNLKNNMQILRSKQIDREFKLKEEDLFDSSQQIEDIKCIFCFDIINIDAIQCDGCGRFFCENCLYIQIQIKNKCPYCDHHPFTKRNIGRYEKIYLEKFKFYCPLRCGQIVTILDADKHKNSCPNIKEIFKCNLCYQELENENNVKEKHLANCPKLIIQCPYCFENKHDSEYLNHLVICEDHLSNCNECEFLVKTKTKQSHSHICNQYQKVYKLIQNLQGVNNI